MNADIALVNKVSEKEQIDFLEIIQRNSDSNWMNLKGVIAALLNKRDQDNLTDSEEHFLNQVSDQIDELIQNSPNNEIKEDCERIKTLLEAPAATQTITPLSNTTITGDEVRAKFLEKRNKIELDYDEEYIAAVNMIEDAINEDDIKDFKREFFHLFNGWDDKLQRDFREVFGKVKGELQGSGRGIRHYHPMETFGIGYEKQTSERVSLVFAHVWDVVQLR